MTIPASELVTVNPAVAAVGGSNLLPIGMVGTANTRVPIGAATSLPSALAVSNFFGPASQEALLAPNYFNGYDNSSKKPAALIFYQIPYNGAVPGYAQGTTFGNAPFVVVPIGSGSFSPVIDGIAFGATGINLSTANSYSGVAATIQTALQTAAPTIASATTSSISGTTFTVGTITAGAFAVGQTITGGSTAAGTTLIALLTGSGGTGSTFTVNTSQTVSSATIVGTYSYANVTANINAQNKLNVTAVASGSVAIGQLVTTAGVPAGVTITSFGTGTGGTGTYNLSNTGLASTASGPATIGLTMTFDAVSSSYILTSGTTGPTSSVTVPNPTAVANHLNMATTTVSPGAAQVNGSALTGALNAMLAINSNFMSFTTMFEPVTADKLIIAQWISPLPYWYSMWDTTDASVYTASGDTSSAWYQINFDGLNGVLGVGYDPASAPITACQPQAFFAMGAMACVDYDATNGRITLAYRTQAGLVPACLNQTSYNNMTGGQAPFSGNGYSVYGSFANPGNGFINFQNGRISGQWKWLDSYTNQIWLNNNLQTALIQLLQSIGSIPFNPAGYALIRSALYSGAQQGTGAQPQAAAAVGPIAAALNFGAIRAGVVLSANQITEVNNAAGLPIDGTLNQIGWYLQIKDPGATVRVARGSPIVNFWYMDGQSIQYINVSSVDVL